MDQRPDKRLTSRELDALFDRLFPHGFASADVRAEIAPEGWEHSPLRVYPMIFRQLKTVGADCVYYLLPLDRTCTLVRL